MKPKLNKIAIAIATTVLLVVFQNCGPYSTAVAQVVLPPVTDPLNSTLDPLIRRPQGELDNRVRRRVDSATDTVEDGTLPGSSGELLETVDQSIDVAETVVATTGGVVATLARPFVADIDSHDWVIEKDVLVLLLDEAQLGKLSSGDFDIIAQRELPSLRLTMVTLRDPHLVTLPESAEKLRLLLPSAAVDFNHVYRFAADDNFDDHDMVDEPLALSNDATTLRIGMIDSAIATDHFSLRDIGIATEDFVSVDGDRPLWHGTAVASIVARSAQNNAYIYAASVFFNTPNHAAGATTESLVAALDWLATQQVDVINMSLSGPANELLDRAVANVLANGLPVIAAVGNNGPSGEPLYPAAYDGVIGVTAIDRDKKVFRYANRGPHVDFAALGVSTKVADAGAGWRVESGTSMAAPHVAVVFAQTLHSGQVASNMLFDVMRSHAEDLGMKGFDPVFGYGLITESPVLVSVN